MTVEDNTGSALELRRRQLKSQPSTLHTRRQQAVCVRRAYKRYGTKKNPFVILDGLNMTVPKGSIYGLLGASGCGKTTLLSCIVGRKRLNSGEIWVLGGTPGSKGSGVPGPRIGYMPQEIALYGEFSIRETLLYFGRIAGLTKEKIEERLEFLVSFLMLPDANRLVKILSGGQQRRVSLASALLHEPELLILDEPTVGVDPLLRQNIWDHLVNITKGGNTTVIITTHYIDETRQASIIGLMRGGYFLAEESPERLLAQFNAETLEDVFLKLSVIQNMGRRRRSSILQEVTETIQVPSGVVNEAAVLDEEGEISGEFGDNVSMSSRGGRVSITPVVKDTEPSMPELPPEEQSPTECMDYFKVIKMHHMQALIWKNFLWMWRNIPVMLFIIGLPVAQIILFCLSIGHDPYDLPVSIVNFELDQKEECHKGISCNSTRLSCSYLNHPFKFSANYKKLQNYFDTINEAKDSVIRGKSWAVIIVPHNYSDALRERLEAWRYASEWDIEYSSVEVYQDKSNENIGNFLKVYLYETFQKFIQDYLKSCDIDERVVSLPIRIEEPVYGYRHPNFTDFAAPGIILTIIFFLAVALTSGAMLIERNEGSLERSLVIGINGIEILFAHVITQFVVMVGQSIMVLIFSFAVFNLTLNGNIFLVALLTMMTGLCGMCFGFVVSCVCDTERTATYMAMGSFLPMVMLCGIIWPIEGMHQILRIISLFLPLTKSTESLRSILMRGWGFAVSSVYIGFISTVIWIVVFLTFSVLLLKFKKG
ncbi:ABC transporter G family member 20 [Agrilus planipennis]|uniref:ABC transporter G family member 20 n=1 Tax=Agrilus planipennis TaxID=224129 RepID=A0A7F5RJL0_AGRPL|nr:ABC transporter G family member 20 [Agrilus planipennis]